MTALALDRAALLHTATRWTGELIRARLIEAFEVEAKLPGPRGNRGSSSSWPTMEREFSDLVGWSDEARAEVWLQWARAKGAHPWEVTRMGEALDWLPILKDHRQEQQMLHAWANTKALRRSLTKVCRLKGWDKQTFYRRLNAGSERIADELNRKGVAVR
jgi:hypothetical protein